MDLGFSASPKDRTAAERDDLAARLKDLNDQLSKLRSERDDLATQKNAAQDTAADLRMQLSSQAESLQRSQAEADQRAQSAEGRLKETQELLSQAQAMLVDQARYLNELSRKQEDAELALERERRLTAEMVYFVQHSSARPDLDVNRIPRLRAVLETAFREQHQAADQHHAAGQPQPAQASPA